MSRFSYRRRPLPLLPATLAALGILALFSHRARAQDASSSPASIPAGVLQARPASPAASKAAKAGPVSERQAREADDAYLEGAKQMEHDDIPAAERSFARAVQLNPARQEYVLALVVAREHHATELVQAAAKARLAGNIALADSLLAQARNLDPNNDVVTQHFTPDASPLPVAVDVDSLRHKIPTFAGPIELAPTPGNKDLHFRGTMQQVIREVYAGFGINVTFDSSYTSNEPIKFDLDNVDFQAAIRVLADMARIFAVPVQPNSALIAKDTPEDRDRLMPLVEETVYLPGVSNEEMTEMANLARNIFNLKEVTASSSGGDMLLRGDEGTLRALNATYTDILDGGSDVLLDIKVYEVDKTHLVNIGASTPSSISGFPIVATAENLINANQSTLDQAIANGLLKLTGTQGQQDLEELEFLIGSGIVSSSQFTNLLGVAGVFAGFPLAGFSLGSSGTFDLLLNSSDVRMLDDIQLRSGNNQDSEFRVGTRYPVVTATYSSGVSSSLASSLAGVTVNGTSASSLLSQYLGTSSATVPQVQYEDLGITVKTTPHIQRSGNVSMKLDMKIEALGSGTIDSIPILNNRSLVSTFTIPAGQTALLASEISRNEARDIEGIPGLSELPGFQGTEKSAEIDTDELLITITPHVVRTGRFRVTSQRIMVGHATTEAQ